LTYFFLSDIQGLTNQFKLQNMTDFNFSITITHRNVLVSLYANLNTMINELKVWLLHHKVKRYKKETLNSLNP